MSGTIDGRDWKTYFPQPLKHSAFSWKEFARRVEVLQQEKNQAQDKENEKFKEALRSKYINVKNTSNQNNNTKDIVMSNNNNPYKTINNDAEDDDDEKW